MSLVERVSTARNWGVATHPVRTDQPGSPVAGRRHDGCIDVAGVGCRACPLSQVRCGVEARVLRLSGPPQVVRRLQALGLRPSADCRVLGRSLGTGAVRVRAGTTHLMVRRAEAGSVWVEVPEGGVRPDAVWAL